MYKPIISYFKIKSANNLNKHNYCSANLTKYVFKTPNKVLTLNYFSLFAFSFKQVL